MREALPFVDAHMHLWDLDRIHYDWLTPPFSEDGPNGNVAAIARTYRVADYLTDLAGMSGVAAVHIEAGAHPSRAIEETRWLDNLAEETGVPAAIVAYVQLEKEDAREALADQSAFQRVRGVRQILNWHADPDRTYSDRDLSLDEKWRSGFALLSQFRLSFDLQCYPRQMLALAPLFASHPDIPVIINHLGMPVLSDPNGLADWREGMRALATLSHVSVKLSGFGFIRRDWTIETVLPFAQEAMDLFGTSRCMFASDTPTDKLFAPLSASWAFFDAIVQNVSEPERRDMFGRNANRIYRLGLDI